MADQIGHRKLLEPGFLLSLPVKRRVLREAKLMALKIISRLPDTSYVQASTLFALLDEPEGTTQDLFDTVELLTEEGAA